jgi:hypothetical protein
VFGPVLLFLLIHLLRLRSLLLEIGHGLIRSALAALSPELAFTSPLPRRIKASKR